MRESSTQAAAGKEALEKQVGAPVPWLALHPVQLALQLLAAVSCLLNSYQASGHALFASSKMPQKKVCWHARSQLLLN